MKQTKTLSQVKRAITKAGEVEVILVTCHKVITQ
jgi:hypothetical protein